MVHNRTCGCPKCFPINCPHRANPHGGETRRGTTVDSFPSTFRTISGYRENDFCCQITCRDCGKPVFLIHHNGGYVLVNELGWPWPIHECFLSDHPRGGERRIYSGEVSLRSLASTPVERPQAVRLGLIVRSAAVPRSSWTILAVKIQNMVGKCFAIRQTDRILAGILVRVNEEDGRILLDDGTELSILASVNPEFAGLTQRWLSNPTEETRQ